MKFQFNLENKVVVVTGGAGLLGQIFVKSICEAGAIAVIAEYNLDIARQAEKELKQVLPSANIVSVEMDITSKISITNAISELVNKLGSIDALVNNAYPRNANYGKVFFEVEYDDFCENVGMNLGGYFLTSQQFSHYFKTCKAGNIINISSIYGVIAPRFEVYDNTPMTMPVEYAAIKAGLIHLTKYMCKYLKGTGIRINTLSPGGISDNQNPDFIKAYNNLCMNKGMLDKEDMVGTLLFLLSDASEYITGQNLIVDDGFTL